MQVIFVEYSIDEPRKGFRPVSYFSNTVSKLTYCKKRKKKVGKLGKPFELFPPETTTIKSQLPSITVHYRQW